jgi:UDP-glucose 4-epimerase
LGRYFRIPPDLRDLNYGKFVEQGEPRISQFEDYNSTNTERLDVEQMRAILLKLGFIRRLLAGEAPNGEE